MPIPSVRLGSPRPGGAIAQRNRRAAKINVITLDDRELFDNNG